MTRGNQRELARAKNAKKEAAKKGGNAKSGSEMAKANLNNAEIMQKKQAEANQKKKEKEDAELKAKIAAKMQK